MRNMKQQGVTLIELMVALMVIAIAWIGTVKLIAWMQVESVLPMHQDQALNIAENYLDRILALPTGLDQSTDMCPKANAMHQTVCDYQSAHDAGAHGADGKPVIAWQAYDVAVQILPQQTVGPLSMMQVTVNVSHPSLANPVRLIGYRARHG